MKKYPVEKIRFSTKYLSFANKVNDNEVNRIVSDFHIEGWEPIFLNPKYYLIDGQHRFRAAMRMGLKFLDVVIINDNKGK